VEAAKITTTIVTTACKRTEEDNKVGVEAMPTRASEGASSSSRKCCIPTPRFLQYTLCLLVGTIALW